MKFTFSIRTALHQSWNLFAKHAWFFVGLAFVMAVFSIFSSMHQERNALDITLSIVVMIASVLWSYVWISASLAAVDGHEDLLKFGLISQHMPSVRQFFILIGVGLLVGIIVAAGFVLLIIPGVYFLVRLSFANTAVADRQEGVLASMKYSWQLVRGKIFWTVLLVLIMNVALIILGALPLMLGLLVTYPIAMLLMARLYRDLTVHHRQVSEAAKEE